MSAGINRVAATLRKPIIQAGVLRQAGERVTLRHDQAERLAKAGIIEAPSATPARTPKRKSTSTRGDDNE